MILEKEEHFNRQTTDTKHTPTLFGELHEPRAGLPHTIPRNSELFDDTFLPYRRGATLQAMQNVVFSIEPELALAGVEHQELLYLCRVDCCRHQAKGAVVAPSYIRSEKRHVESVMIVAKQAQKADFLNG